MARALEDPIDRALLNDRPRIHHVYAVAEVRHDTEIGGHAIGAGEKVLISWASANRDGDEFPDPDVFDLDRERNRHIAFGAGPHRCAGSNLARLNLRIAVHELVQRLDDLTLLVPEEELPFHSAFNRSPLAMPLAFRPGPRS